MGQTLSPEQRPEQRLERSAEQWGSLDATARPAPPSVPGVSMADASQPTLPMVPALPARPTRFSRDRSRDDAPRPNPLWQVVKWPVRKALLGASLAVDALHRRSRVALGIAVIVALALIVGGVIFAVTRSAPPRSSAPPIVRVEQPALPPLPATVQRFLHARQRFDAAGMWPAYDTAGQRALGMTESQLQAALDQQKRAGETITRYVYTGGYKAPDGTAHYTIEAYMVQQGHTTVFTWYLDVGSDGMITRLTDLTAR